MRRVAHGASGGIEPAWQPGPALARGLAHGPHRLDDRIRVRELPGAKFGMDALAIDSDFEGAPARGDELQRSNMLLELEKFVRQTDGVWLIVSSGAIFDRDIQSHKTVGQR